MKKNSALSLKSFTETCAHVLEQCSADELKQIILEMVDQVSIEKRQSFLDLLSRKKTAELKLPTDKENVLDEIEEIKSEILEATHEEPDWENYEDEDSLSGYEHFIEPLAEIFDRVEACFDYGHYDIARKAYEILFSLFDIEDDYGRSIQTGDLETVDLAQARAKYLCSIYLTEQGQRRVPLLLQAMKKHAYLDWGTRPKLTDLIRVAPTPLPGWTSFLAEWIQDVNQEDTLGYHAWLREATFLREGSAGLEKLALTSGHKDPRTYLDWIRSLMAAGEWEKALQAIHVAFERLPVEHPIKAAVADCMSICGQKIGDADLSYRGLWLSFEHKPSLGKLIEIYEKNDISKRKKVLSEATLCIEKHLKRAKEYRSYVNRSWEDDDIEEPPMVDYSLLLHSLLLAGEEMSAFEMAKKGDSLGWSSSDNPQPLFISYCLIRALKQPLDQLPPYLKQFWQMSLKTSVRDGDPFLKKLESLYREIFQTTDSIENAIFNWSLTAVEQRVSAIVSHQHRGAYDRAALIVGACTEVLKRITPQNAMDLFNRMKLKFPRHPAFQSELKKLVF